MKKIAVSVGDLNGISLEILLKSHEKITKICKPVYCVNHSLLQQGAKLLNLDVPKDIKLYETKGDFIINPGQVDQDAGKYSFESFTDAISLAKQKKVHAITTLPINKESWSKAHINYVGHTDYLRNKFKQDAIMMMGWSKMFVAFYTEHIPLKSVASKVTFNKLVEFFVDLYHAIGKKDIAVLGLNPHAGDNGVLGDEESDISYAIKEANKILQDRVFVGPVVPDIAFTKESRKRYQYFVAMYHDQGLAPLKALYFKKSINVSLNLPIIRTSVAHGTAFDAAYKNSKVSTKSYKNAIKEAIALSKLHS
jgi:4-hydroxythreonine-4-phosphate dehydrogenase